jgi:virginiamycin A acetyltransferase
MIRQGAKRVAQAVALKVAFPCALVTMFGHLRPIFTLFSQLLAMGPGLPGDYLRSAYYRLTLWQCSIDTRISFGTYFVRRESAVRRLVSIGGYCAIGSGKIGPETQIGSPVLISGGRHQHNCDASGGLSDTKDAEITIGSRCWIDDGSILLADIGEGSTIATRAAVTKPIPPTVVAVGNPARRMSLRVQLEDENRAGHPK